MPPKIESAPLANHGIKSFFRSGNSQTRFFAEKPARISNWDWICHPTNRYQFESWIEHLLARIDSLAQKFGWTTCKLNYLANLFGKSPRWMGEILSRLESIGVLDRVRIGHNRYRLNPEFCQVKKFAPVSSSHASSHASSGENRSNMAATPTFSTSSRSKPALHMLGMTCHDNTENPLRARACTQVGGEEDSKPVVVKADANPEFAQRMEIAEQILEACEKLYACGLRGTSIPHRKSFTNKLAQKTLPELQQDLAGHLIRIQEYERKREAQGGPGSNKSVPQTEEETKWGALSPAEQDRWNQIALNEMGQNGRFAEIRREFDQDRAEGAVWVRARELWWISTLQVEVDEDSEPDYPETNWFFLTQKVKVAWYDQALARAEAAGSLPKPRSQMLIDADSQEMWDRAQELFEESVRNPTEPPAAAASYPMNATPTEVATETTLDEPKSAWAGENATESVSDRLSEVSDHTQQHLEPPLATRPPADPYPGKPNNHPNRSETSPAGQRVVAQAFQKGSTPTKLEQRPPDANAFGRPNVEGGRSLASMQAELNWQRLRTQEAWQREEKLQRKKGQNQALRSVGSFDYG